jgi:hypothetical protein
VIKRVLRAGRVLVTTVKRVGVLMMVTALLLTSISSAHSKMLRLFRLSGSYGRMTEKEKKSGSVPIFL